MTGDPLDLLLSNARGGDESAYRQFLAKAADRLRADLRRMVADDAELEAIVRECLLAVHRKRHTLVAGRLVSPWLRAIGHYRLSLHLKHKAKGAAKVKRSGFTHPSATLDDAETSRTEAPRAEAEASRFAPIPSAMVGSCRHIPSRTRQHRQRGEAGLGGFAALRQRFDRSLKRLREQADEGQS